MFNFFGLISLLITVIVFYIASFINLKKEIDDLSTASENSSENYVKTNIRKKNLKLLNIVTFFLIAILIIIYILSLYGITFSDIGRFILTFLPFKKGFFSNSNFRFSYITGIILSLIIDLLIWAMLQFTIIEPTHIHEYITEIIVIFILTIGLIWANYFISNFLVYCIMHCFEFLSIILNFTTYFVIGAILIIIFYLYDEIL